MTRVSAAEAATGDREVYVTDVLVLERLDEVGDTLVLWDGGDAMRVEHRAIHYVFVGAAKQQDSRTFQLHAHTHIHWWLNTQAIFLLETAGLRKIMAGFQF